MSNHIALISQRTHDAHNIVIPLLNELQRSYNTGYKVDNPLRIIIHSRTNRYGQNVIPPRYYLGCEHWLEHSPEEGVVETVHIPEGWTKVSIRYFVAPKAEPVQPSDPINVTPRKQATWFARLTGQVDKEFKPQHTDIEATWREQEGQQCSAESNPVLNA